MAELPAPANWALPTVRWTAAFALRTIQTTHTASCTSQLAPVARSSVYGAVVPDGAAPGGDKATAAATAADAADEYDEGLQ